MLRAKGYDVVVLPGATAGLARSQLNDLDLVITDVLLPITSGAALVELLRERRPSLGALFSSGYASSIIDETTRFLPRPLTAEQER